MAKPLRSAYKAGRVWAKVTHAGTVDVTVVGSTGNTRHPKALAVRLPDHRNALPQRLTTPLAAAIAPRLVPLPEGLPESRRLLCTRPKPACAERGSGRAAGEVQAVLDRSGDQPRASRRAVPHSHMLRTTGSSARPWLVRM